MNPGDISWMLLASSLVMLMTPAVGLFYGGMVQRKHLISTIMKSFTAMGIITILWVLFGYSLAFGQDHWGLIGGLNYLGLQGVGGTPNPTYATTIPHSAFMLFQMKFAVITPALIIGAFVERIRFSSFLWFSVLWSLFVYIPMAHWVWGDGGWLREMGALDFAGGTVIHILSGVAALAAAMVIRKRKTFGNGDPERASIPMTLVGAVLLWFGWFGFNGGSSLAANELAVHAVLTTTVATAAAATAWMFLTWRKGRPNLMGMATGAVVGLVAITPACGFVEVIPAMAIGAIGALVSYKSIQLKEKLQIDETLDVWACHGMAGTWGALATGLFATTSVNPDGANGWFYGNPEQFWIQFLSVVVAWVFSFTLSYIIAYAVETFHGLSVSEEDEELGLDITQHGEVAFSPL